MDTTNEWMDDTEKLLKSFHIGMEPEEASKLQEKTEVCFKLLKKNSVILLVSLHTLQALLVLQALWLRYIKENGHGQRQWCVTHPEEVNGLESW